MKNFVECTRNRDVKGSGEREEREREIDRHGQRYRVEWHRDGSYHAICATTLSSIERWCFFLHAHAWVSAWINCTCVLLQARGCESRVQHMTRLALFAVSALSPTHYGSSCAPLPSSCMEKRIGEKGNETRERVFGEEKKTEGVNGRKAE